MSKVLKKQPAGQIMGFTTRFTLLLLVAATLSGCMGFLSQSKAKETRNLSATFVSGESLQVTTANGRVEVIVEAGRADIGIEATVTGAGSTYEAALNHLSEISVIVDHAEGNVLDVSVDYGPNGRQRNDGCSFVIRLPAVNGVVINTRNGSIKLTDTTGIAQLTTSNGAVTILRHAGALTVETSNGSVKAEDVSGKVDIVTSNGRITYVSTGNVSESFTLRSSNGSIQVTVPASIGGRINARTSNGSVRLGGSATPESVSGSRKDRTIVLAGDTDQESKIRTSNGTITITIQD